jgi:hypothetical protein
MQLLRLRLGYGGAGDEGNTGCEDEDEGERVGWLHCGFDLGSEMWFWGCVGKKVIVRIGSASWLGLDADNSSAVK